MSRIILCKILRKMHRKRLKAEKMLTIPFSRRTLKIGSAIGRTIPRSASKVVNADGTPKIMYHGSPNSFTAFDKKKAKSSGLYGKGLY